MMRNYSRMGFLNKNIVLSIFIILICISSAFGDRWSRQLSPNVQSVGNDWVPISNEKVHDKAGRSLQFGEDLATAEQQQYQYFAEPLNNRYNLKQTHPLPSASEINQFVSQSDGRTTFQTVPPVPQFHHTVPPVPAFQFVNQQQSLPKLRTSQNFGGPVQKPFAEPLIQQQRSAYKFVQNQVRGPQVQQYQSPPSSHVQHFGNSHVVPHFQQLPIQHQRTPQFQTHQQPPQQQQQPQQPQFQSLLPQPNQGQSEEEVQLLYVPYDTLYQQKQQQQQQQSQNQPQFQNINNNRFNTLNQPVSASLINDFYSTNEIQQFPLPTIITTTRRPATNRQTPPQTTQRPTTPFTSYYQPIPTELPASSKPKAHQPPLSMFMINDKFTGKVTESDVLSTLRKSNSIDVRDTVTKNSPKVFIGPSGMPPPEGYSKFELPYLSAIENNRFERKIEQLPFFVAPLSYRTPPGFSKIPLPAPHVGSVVVNQPHNTVESNESEVITADNYYTKPPIGATVRINPTNFDAKKPDTQKITLTSGFNYRPNSEIKLISNDYIFSSLPPHVQAPTSPQYQSRPTFTTPKPDYFPTSSPSLLRTPLTKVKYSAIEEQRNNEFQTTLLPTTTRAPVTRQRFSEFEQPKTDFYSSTRSSTPRTPTLKSTYEELDEHKTINEEYFNVELNNKPKYKISFSGSTNTPAKNFNFKPIPEFNFDSFTQTSDYMTTKKPRTKVRTEQTKYQDEEQQFKENSQVQSFPSSTPLPTQSFDYTPTVSAIQNTDNYRQTNGGSTNGGNYFTETRSSPRPHSTVSTTTRFASEEIEERPENDDFARHRFNFANNVEKNAYNPTQDSSYTPQQYHTETTGRSNTPEFENASPTTTENPNYSLPSELPAINAHLPGLVNSLMEEKWMTKNTIPEVDASTTTTARPVARGRRPVSSSSSTYRATASTTESSTDNFTRRPVNRGRRPSTYNTREATSTTESSARTRAPVVRGPSRVKYNPSPEERQQFKSRGRTPSTSKQVKKEDQAIEYQRDVLNQNYPTSIQPIQQTEKPIEEYNLQDNNNEQQQVIQEEVQSIVNESNENVNDYNVTPQADNIDVIPLGGNVKFLDDEQNNNYTPRQVSLQYESNEDTLATTQEPQANNHKYSQNFLGLQEPMQVPLPQKTLFKHKGNHRNIESFYNTNSQNSQSSKPNYDDDITATQTSPTTRLTTTTPEPTTTDAPVTKRTNFPRRRLTYTTTEGPKTSSEATDSSDSYTSRTKTRVDSRKEGAVVVKKVRGRVRQSTTTSTTETPNENETTKRTSTVTRSRTITSRNNNRENTKERTNNNNENAEESKPRFRIRENTQRFRLEPQESQWSTRFSQNSFQPVDEEKSKSVKSLSVDDEQEIVTASSDSDPMETYLFNVSASVVPTKTVAVENDDETSDESINMISTTEKEIDLKRRHKDSDFDSSFEKLVQDVMTEVDEEIEGKKELKSEKKKPVINEKKGNQRRGVWKRVKVRPADSFEAAESQNIGKHYYNTISVEEMKDSTRKGYDYETKMVKQEQVNVVTESSAEMEDSEEVIGEDAAVVVPTVKSDEPILEHIFSEIAETTTNMPGENIENETPKSEIFEVAKKALHEIFNFEDSDDDAIDMEEMDDKLENEYSTSTQSTTEDQSTTVTTTEIPEIQTTEQAKPMGSLVNPQVITSTSTKVTHETEICYRGRCIKTEES